MIRSFDELQEAALAAGPMRVAVASANDAETLKAVVEAKRIGLADAVLVGNQEWIDLNLKKMGADPGDFIHMPERDPAMAATAAVATVNAGDADIIMKGHLQTSTFLHAVLHGEHSLRKDPLLSDVVVYEDTRGGASRLMVMSDGGINIAPGIREKLQVIKNSVSVAHHLGIRKPRVALLSGSERIHPDFQSTIDAVALVKMYQQGAAENCIVDGPFALDNAISAASARAKGIESPVAGQADVLIVPNLEAGNIFGKALQYYANKLLIHVAVGAKVPVLIPSRTAPAEGKLGSIVLAVLMCSAKKKSTMKK